jgi:hypothetical protein
VAVRAEDSESQERQEARLLLRGYVNISLVQVFLLQLFAKTFSGSNLKMKEGRRVGCGKEGGEGRRWRRRNKREKTKDEEDGGGGGEWKRRRRNRRRRRSLSGSLHG